MKEKILHGRLLPITHICWKENVFQQTFTNLSTPFINYTSHVTVIPSFSKQCCAFFQWSWAVKRPLFRLMPLCLKTHCGTSATSRKMSWKGRATDLSRKTVTLPLISISTKCHVHMCICVYIQIEGGLMVNHFARLWSIGICNDADMKHLAVHDAQILPTACTFAWQWGNWNHCMGEYFCGRLWSLSLCCGWWCFEATFPTSVWEGHRARDGLRRGGEKKSSEWSKLHSPLVHNVTV